ncbi:DNA polymerase [Stenotrophomonas phage DLP4]|nr:DNA polymerase [Stenotrophomonas phage DLP4]
MTLEIPAAEKGSNRKKRLQQLNSALPELIAVAATPLALPSAPAPTPQRSQIAAAVKSQLFKIASASVYETAGIQYDNPPKATIDFETRSVCSIKDCGSWRYSLDPTTEVMCLAFRLPHWEEGRTALWHPAFPQFDVEEADCPELAELFEWIREGRLVEAHNAWFERGIWTNVCVPRLNWPAIGHEQWRCSAAKAAAYSLPRKLADLAPALALKVEKDTEGAKVMKKMAKPRKPLKRDVVAWIDDNGSLALPAKKYKIELYPNEDGTYNAVAYHPDPDVEEEVFRLPVFWNESAELLARLCSYCRIDVLAEEAVSHRLRDLSPKETEMYLMDQAINQRGFQLDREGIEAALEIVDGIFTELNKELVEITGGRVQKATQRARMIEWFNDNGLPIENTQGGTIDSWLRREDIAPKLRRALELVRALGRSSTAKFIAAQNWADPETWRIHGGLLYHGAGTGRWSGSGVQPHNFPRGNIKNMELAWEIIKSRDLGMMEMLYGDAMELLSYALRGMIVPTPGRRLMVADYAAIEARVVLWLAGDDEALEVFRRNECIYMAMATEIYGRHIYDKEAQADERQMGKQAVLGLGYQMGAKKFRATLAEKYGIFIEEEFAQKIVDAYRAKFWRVKKMWWDQEAAAIAAVRTPGRIVKCGRVQWCCFDGFLHCKLPSGRLLGYCDPRIVMKPTPWGEKKPALTYMGVDPYTKKWRRQDTYGGMLVENITQASARDLMADAMLRCHKEGLYDVILSVHDELIAECDMDAGDVKDFEATMAYTLDWADGCPVKAEGWTGMRYRK